MPSAVTTWAGDVTTFGERRAQSLTREFHQAKAGNFSHLNARTIVVQCIFETVFNFTLILGILHVDEVDHNQATQVTQA